jgi:3-hydroxybutyryl-CoA dehydrogenase
MKQIAVIGAGTMGHGIAQLFASAGLAVSLTDQSPGVLDGALDCIETSLQTFLEHNLIPQDQIAATLQRISKVSDLAEAVGPADFIVEAVSESIETKHAVLSATELHCRQDTIITSTTSSFCAGDLAPALNRPERFLVTHYWNPPTIIPIVEVVRGEATLAQVVESTMSLLRDVGKLPVLINKDVPGFVGNRLQHALRREAIAIVAEGIASPQDVDLIAKRSFGLRLPVVGPLETADMGGLDLTLAIQAYLLPELNRSTQPLPLVREMADRGDLGVKTGKGFYEWPADRARQTIKSRDVALIEMIKWLKG